MGQISTPTGLEPFHLEDRVFDLFGSSTVKAKKRGNSSITLDPRRSTKASGSFCSKSTLRSANILDATAQPAMGFVGIQPWMPKQRNRDLRQDDRKRKCVHPRAQISSVTFGNGCNQISPSGQGQG